jgi:hypothetical protein
MHLEAMSFVASAVRTYDARGPVYEIGSKNINGTVRVLFPGDDYLGIDVVAGPCVDVVADGATYVPPTTPATVVCCEVLEHTEWAGAIVTQAAKVLGDGGLLIISCAGDGRAPHSAVDGGRLRQGEFYDNLSREQVADWARTAGIAELPQPCDSHPGDTYFVGRKVAS